MAGIFGMWIAPWVYFLPLLNLISHVAEAKNGLLNNSLVYKTEFHISHFVGK
jgi:hypothetical protein